MRRMAFLISILTLFGMWFSARPLEADDGIPIDMDPVIECIDAVPHLPTEFTRDTIPVRVVVALDGVSKAKAREIMATVARAYAAGPVPQLSPDVAVNVIAYHDLTGKLKGNTVSPVVLDEDPKGTDLMSQLIRHYHRRYPKLRRDHVHLMTRRNITVPPVGDATLGIANCLGSIGTKYSYSIGETGNVKAGTLGPLHTLEDADAKIVAHEMGHAFGAHHHYANCAEGVPSSVGPQRAEFCTLMFNSLSYLNLEFGTLEVAAVRGTAEAHLKH